MLLYRMCRYVSNQRGSPKERGQKQASRAPILGVSTQSHIAPPPPVLHWLRPGQVHRERVVVDPHHDEPGVTSVCISPQSHKVACQCHVNTSLNQIGVCVDAHLSLLRMEVNWRDSCKVRPSEFILFLVLKAVSWERLYKWHRDMYVPENKMSFLFFSFFISSMVQVPVPFVNLAS